MTRVVVALLIPLIVCLLIVLGFGPTVMRAQQPAASTPLVFDGVTVIDVEHGQRLSTQRVVIVGNRIQSVESARTGAIPAGAHVVDARGKYLIPGLWDMHTHAKLATRICYPLFVASGVTGIRDAGSMVPLDTLRFWRREILAGPRVGPPRQLLSGPAIDARDGKCLGEAHHICVADQADARRVVDSLHAAGADIIKTYGLGRATYFAVAAEARRVGMPFGGHVLRGTGITSFEASDSGANILDHVNASARLNSLCVGDTASVQQCGRAAQQFRHNGTWWVPTLIAMESLRRDPSFQNPVLNRSHRTVAGDTIFMRWNEFTRAFWTGSASRLDLQHGPTGSAAQRVQALHLTSPADTSPGGIFTIADRVGLPMLVGTDVAGADRTVVPGFALYVELALYVAEGLTPLEALQTATLNPAKLLHGTDSLGTVTPGKLADVVLLDADPLQDIRNTTAIRAVVANGRYFDRAALDRLVATARDLGTPGHSRREVPHT